MTYVEEKRVSLPASRMWEALTKMDRWLPRLETITAVSQVSEGKFFCQDGCYTVETPEGVTMYATLTEIDEQQMRVVIDAKAGPLRSHLTCQVAPETADSCVVRRIQEYPGIVGRIFTSLKGKREAAETAAYLDAWIEFAQTEDDELS